MLQPQHGFYNLFMVPSVSLRSLLDADKCRSTPYGCSWGAHLSCGTQVCPTVAAPPCTALSAYTGTSATATHRNENISQVCPFLVPGFFFYWEPQTDTAWMGWILHPAFKLLPQSTLFWVSHPPKPSLSVAAPFHVPADSSGMGGNG